MFDVFYSGKKPGVFVHEREADNVEHAQQLSTTRYFWWVHYLADLEGWDFSWEPVPWQSHQRHAWPNQHQPDSGIYLVPAKWNGQETNYHSTPVIHHGVDSTYWHIPEWIDAASIDPQWSPDPLDPPYIYEFPVEWGWDKTGGPQYCVPGATEIKYVNKFVAKTRHNSLHWFQHCNFNWTDEIYRWQPNPQDPPYNYVFGNQWYPAETMPTVEYRVPGASTRKYMDMRVQLPEKHSNHWHTLYDCEWDYSWVPDPGDPPYIYVFGNQHWPAETMPTVEYHVPGAIERKYMDMPAKLISNKTNWVVPDTIDPDSVDYSWVPDPGDPPFIYEFATQCQSNGGAKYVVPGATEVKYVDIPHYYKSNSDYWEIPNTIDAGSVDTSWHPSNTEQPYIYEFATQWQSNGGARYVMPGATEIKYVDIQHHYKSNDTCWEIPNTIDLRSVDTSWHPSNTEPAYVYEFATQWQPNGGARYVMPGATEVKYVDIAHRHTSNSDHWEIPNTIDPNSVDTSWHPSNIEQPYIYEFATQWQPNGGARYVVPGATEIKYIDIQHHRLPDKTPWKNLEAVAKFDYSWHPDNTAEPYNYVFGNQHWPGEIMPTVIYCMPGAVQETFVENPVAKLWSCMGGWEFCEDIDDSEWDWTWVPNPKDPPYIYVFGNQWNPPEFKASLKYHVEGATEVKYMDRRTRRLPNYGNQWRVHMNIEEFDYSWEPNPFDPPYIYVFGNQWNSAVLESTVEYHVEGATEIKYVDDIIAKVAHNLKAFELIDDIVEFDYSWRPNPTDPPYIYVFGNQWLAPEQRPALQYRVGNATDIKYMDHPQARRRGDATRFQTEYECEFDWSWEPDPGDPPYIYVFGNQWHTAEIMPTVKFVVPGATEIKYMPVPVAQLVEQHSTHWHTLVNCKWDYSWIPDPGDPPYIYVFGNQWHAAEVMPTVEYHVPGAIERKYMPAPVAELPVDMTLWYVPNNVDITDMDFSWVPDPGSPPYIYQFATQHQKTGGPQYRMLDATEIKYVDMMRVEVKAEAVPIVEIDHLDGNAGNISNTIKRIRYFDNYRDTLIRLAKSLVGEHEYVWVCSSICDYSRFDFSWHPEKWQSTMLHVFPSDEQKFGDTFYMHVPTFAERAEKKQLLEWYSVNYVSRRRVPRRTVPVIQHSEDSQVDAVKNTDWSGPLALFTTTDYVDRALTTVPLWRQETRTIVPLSRGATSVIVPKSAKGDIRTQLYDYPYIDKTKVVLYDRPLDIVFISNGEPNADQHWQDLVYSLDRGHANRAVRVDGVNGRVAAYHAAAEASHTPWFFAVFAKLKVNPDFDWEWQPDRMQQPKHYIFHATNPVNGLVYGHQAMIAYNKKLALENMGQGLDFTLDQPHEVVPILSGIAFYADSPWMAWRTAFREVIKLKASLPDVESEYRLNKWLTRGVGSGEWSTNGAEDAVEFYDAVGGDFAELRKSYDWAWLASYAFMRRSLSAGQ